MNDAYLQNLELNRVEHRLQNAHLRSRPRVLGLVLGNKCNIGCIHCYQSKNGASLLEPAAIGTDLRREFGALYPYLTTLRIQGGEVFAISGFAELLDDVAATVNRPIVSISTNGTLIDDAWAERMVRMPFHSVTISIDAAQPETFARLRKGAHLEPVLENARRIRRWKDRLGSEYPSLDSFFVVMRSNFREIPGYVRMMRELGMSAVALQTIEISRENTSRFPQLGPMEQIAQVEEVAELHSLVRETIARERGGIDIRTSGLTTLFDRHGFDSAFVGEGQQGLYPDGDDLTAQCGELCPNPWTTLFVVENGDVHLCFLSDPVGNLYEEPLAAVWNSPRAVTKRSQMAAGRYLASGCSTQWCGWRDGARAGTLLGEPRRRVLEEFRALASQVGSLVAADPEAGSGLALVRRTLSQRRRRAEELEALFQRLCEINRETNVAGQAYIDELEAHVTALRGELERSRNPEGAGRAQWFRRARRAAGF